MTMFRRHESSAREYASVRRVCVCAYRVERKVCPWPITDEFYTFDSMEIHATKIDLEFQDENFFFFHSILFIAKVNLLKNGKNTS